MKEVNKCRLCDSSNISEIWNFNNSPLPNNFRLKREEKEEEYPLIYFKCNECHSVQLKYEVDPEILFKDYNYESPPNLIPHFKELAKTTTEFLGIISTDRIIDIGSNNGLLLQEFKNLGQKKVVGFEPCDKIAQKARGKGIGTLSQFFNGGSAEEFALQYKRAELITCTNCFAHVPNLNEFIDGVRIVLADDGYFVFENAYLLNTIENLDLGQSYFEHIFMHSITPLEKFFNKHGLELFKVEYNNVQMGSIRGYVRWKTNQKIKKDDSVIRGSINELLKNLDKLETYRDFINDINEIKDSLLQELDALKIQNKSISIYGWPAKMTLLNKYFGLEKYIDYVIEESPVKTGKYCPGAQLEIKNLDYFKQNPTDYCIIGAYNFEQDIKNKNTWYNGTWINPLKK